MTVEELYKKQQEDYKKTLSNTQKNTNTNTNINTNTNGGLGNFMSNIFKQSNVFDDGYDFGIERAISLAEDLDDPVVSPELEKPVVPQFLADWYEEHKDNFEIHLSGLCINFTCHRERLNDKLANWYEQLENKPIQTLVNMHQLGYEIKKEKNTIY